MQNFESIEILYARTIERNKQRKNQPSHVFLWPRARVASRLNNGMRRFYGGYVHDNISRENCRQSKFVVYMNAVLWVLRARICLRRIFFFAPECGNVDVAVFDAFFQRQNLATCEVVWSRRNHTRSLIGSGRENRKYWLLVFIRIIKFMGKTVSLVYQFLRLGKVKNYFFSVFWSLFERLKLMRG